MEERRKTEAQESHGRFDEELHSKMAASQRAAVRGTAKRVLQAAAAMRTETDTEQSLAKVFTLHLHIFTARCTYSSSAVLLS